MKFTQEIKDNWLKALKSGKYKQGFGDLVINGKSEDTYFCCIGVLGDCTKGLNNFVNELSKKNPYTFLTSTIGKKLMDNLYEENDKLPYNELRDYSNVIPLIEALEVQE